MASDNNTEGNPPWTRDLEAVKRDPSQLGKWDALLASFDAYLKSVPSSSVPLQHKKVIHDAYLELLGRYPLLSLYWRVWLVVEYSLNGVDSSIKILSNAVSKFPRSIELWRDYLAALISQYESSPKDDDLNKIRFYYERAISLNGLHFNGHPLWDTILDFETKIDALSPIVLKLYSQVTKVPCYQYARYYTQFIELRQNFSVTEMIPAIKHDYYIERHNVKSLDDLAEAEKQQVIDEYAQEIFAQVQLLVANKWEFESLLLHPDFSPQPNEEQTSEVEVWLRYLKNELNRWKAGDEEEFQHDLVVSVFERALIPNCRNTDLWLKYMAFLNVSTEKSKLRDVMTSVYERSIALIPLEQVNIRLSYARFLMGSLQQCEAIEYLLDLVKSCSQATPCLEEQACDALTLLLTIWQKSLPLSSFLSSCEMIIAAKLGEDTDGGTKPTKRRHVSPGADLGIKKEYSDCLIELLDSNLTATLAVLYLRNLQASGTREDSFSKMRHFFNEHHRNPIFASSTSFWKTFMDLEGVIDFNAKNLWSVFRFISKESNLSKVVVDAFTEYMGEIVCANHADHTNDQHELAKILITESNDTSSSLVHNQPACLRLAKHNYMLAQDSRSDQDGPSFLRLAKKQASHPGLFIDATPEITNTSLKDGTWVSLGRSRIEPLPLPAFKNVERANATPKVYD